MIVISSTVSGPKRVRRKPKRPPSEMLKRK